MKFEMPRNSSLSRRSFIGGSDARIILGHDEVALIRLWREKRGEIEPEDLSGNLIVQLGIVTEPLNRQWFERNTGRAITDVQKRIQHPVVRWMGATLDGVVEATGAVFEAKFMLPWSFSEEAAAQKYLPQLQHNMWVTNSTTSVLSVITGGGKWVEIAVPADSLYQHLLFTAEKRFWRCVESGEPPRLFGIETPPPRIGAVRVVDMSSSNSWAEFAAQFRETRAAFLKHENAKAELKSLMPEDAKEAVGHGVRARRSKSGTVSFEIIESEPQNAALQ
jgi:predicted phage-related endonuclease